MSEREGGGGGGGEGEKKKTERPIKAFSDSRTCTYRPVSHRQQLACAAFEIKMNECTHSALHSEQHQTLNTHEDAITLCILFAVAALELILQQIV